MMYGVEPKKERFCLNNENRPLQLQRGECPTNLVDVLSQQERLDQQQRLIQDLTIEKHHNDQKRLHLYNLDFEALAQLQLETSAKTSPDPPTTAESMPKREKAESASLKDAGDGDESHDGNQMFKIIHDVRHMNKAKHELLQQCHENLHGNAEALIPEEILTLIDDCETRGMDKLLKFGIEMGDEVMNAYKACVNKNQFRYIIFRPNAACTAVEIEKEGERDSDWEEFVNSVEPTSSRWMVYELEWEAADGRKLQKVCLITYAPTECASTSEKFIVEKQTAFLIEALDPEKDFLVTDWEFLRHEDNFQRVFE